ncbi:hypothetical protein [uncultured Variovorax sp.]|uniref:AbiTii domain-containing protein n=1 Tax=uncultured Variovorax sp. TaxID=114708 RepID=UPI0025DC4A13|nr:hypothetical protein [uncultured Variovorax sp.]
MTGLVLDLQRDALDSSVPVGALLRKASVISRKLDLKDVDDWIGFELGGYVDTTVPEFRKGQGEVKAWNPFNGWIPIIMADTQTAELFNSRYIAQSIFELEDLLANGSGQLILKYPPKQQALLMQLMELQLQPVLHIPRQAILRVIQTVRDRVLNLALDWEKRGILGEGLRFTSAEKANANAISYTTINHIGEMHNSQLQQHSSGAQTLHAGDAKALIALADAVSAVAGQLKLGHEERAELEAELATLRTQAGSPKPKAGIIRATLVSLKTILEGCAGNMAATGLLAQITPLLASVSGS